jgi:hypothetical protein
MLTLLFFQDERQPPIQLDSLTLALEAEEGLELDGAEGDAYRGGRWSEPATRARAVIDCGQAPVEDDPLHPPKVYPGWRQLPLTVQLPLAGPHWCAVEALAMVERLLQRLPDVGVIDTEELREPDDDAPTPIDRLRVLASWERLIASQLAGCELLPQLPRLASIALWRYRRERRACERRAGSVMVWPEALCLVEGGRAWTCALWMDPELPLALPPVELLVIRRSAVEVGVLPVDELLTAAGEPPAGNPAGARFVQPSAATRSLFAGAVLQPIARYRFVDLYDLVD